MTAWLGRYSIVVLVGCLTLSHLGGPRIILAQVMGLQGLRRVVPRVSPVTEAEYFAGILQGLGLRPPPAGSAIDGSLVARIDRRAPPTGTPWRVLGSYALLATPPDVATAERWFARADQTSSDARLIWLWRGRAAWVRGDKSAAMAWWYRAFGAAGTRPNLAKALYLVGEVPLAIDATLSSFDPSHDDDHLRASAFETLRYWMFWRARSQEDVLAWCDRILAPQSMYDPSTDAMAADVVALRAFSLLVLTHPVEGREVLAHAERLRNGPYVQAVRALERMRAGDVARAAQIAIVAAEQAGSDGHALLLAGHVLWELGDRIRAMRAWQQVVERDPLLAGTAEGRIAEAKAQR